MGTRDSGLILHSPAPGPPRTKMTVTLNSSSLTNEGIGISVLPFLAWLVGAAVVLELVVVDGACSSAVGKTFLMVSISDIVKTTQQADMKIRELQSD